MCSRFDHMQRDCTCACAMACLHPHNSISDVVSLMIYDNQKMVTPPSPPPCCVCPFKTPSCVHSKRLRVYQQHAHMLLPAYTGARFDCTHGGVLNLHTGPHCTHTTTTATTTRTADHTTDTTHKHHAQHHTERDRETEKEDREREEKMKEREDKGR